MSYEGYSQLLCEEGHQHTVDCNCPIPRKCFCGSKIVWENMVDVTNGSFADDGSRIDGYVQLKPIFISECEKCHTVLETRYEIPKDKGQLITKET